MSRRPAGGPVPWEVAVGQMTVGGQPYWAADGIVAFLGSAASHWDEASDAGDTATPQVARRLRQLSVQLAAEAIQQHDWWAGHRPGRPAPPQPASSLPGGARIRTAIRYAQGESHLYLSAADVSGFLRDAAGAGPREQEQLFDRASAARMAGRYLDAIAEQLGLEAMLVSGPHWEQAFTEEQRKG